MGEILFILPSLGANWLNALQLALMAGFGGLIVWLIEAHRRTRHRLVESELARRSAERIQHALDGLLEGCQIVGEDWRYLYVNRVAARHGRRSPEELMGRTMMEMYPGIETTPLFAILRRCRERRVPEQVENEFVYPDGAKGWFQLSIQPVPEGLFVLSIDVTARKEAEAGLQAQLDRLSLLHQIAQAVGEHQDLPSVLQAVVRNLEDHLPVDFACACLLDAAAGVLRVTSAGLRSAPVAQALARAGAADLALGQEGLAALSRGELHADPETANVASPLQQRLAAAGLHALVAAPLKVGEKLIGALLVARQGSGAFGRGDCEFLRQLSEHVALTANHAQLHGALREAYDDLRLAEAAVVRQERLRALGQMAGGIAHDLNNAMSPATLYVEVLLEKESNLGPAVRAGLETVHRSLRDVAATVARLRDFSRQREPEAQREPIDLNRLVTQVLDLTRSRWSSLPQQHGLTVEMHTDLAGDLPPVQGSGHEIRDALTNLIFNAVDALPQGGTITVGTRRTADGADPVAGAEKVVLEVADTGIGMDEATRRRSTEPFFSTKGEQGTGLGLAMVCGMAQRHGAKMDIESEVGRGTTVRLVFPASRATGAARERPAERPAAGRRLLVIDDDPLVLQMLGATLANDGHEIVTASGGRDGIEAFETALAQKTPFEVVITDQGMPEVDGARVAGAVKSRAPATPVILLTGWGPRRAGDRDFPAHVDLVLGKPPTLPELRAALARFGPPRA